MNCNIVKKAAALDKANPCEFHFKACDDTVLTALGSMWTDVHCEGLCGDSSCTVMWGHRKYLALAV